MIISNQVALVTGANRGIGRQFVLELLERGVSKVYAAARNPDSLDFDDERVVPLSLDLLDAESVTRAAVEAPDVSLLINNAGIATGVDLLDGELREIHREMDTHFWGTLGVIRAFAPSLIAQGGGIVNILSALSWFSIQGTGGYSAAKAAEWNLTNAIRFELEERGVLVQGVHLGAADTDITANYDGPKIHPRDVPKSSLDGLEQGSIEVIVDDWSAMVKASLAQDPADFYRQARKMLGPS